MKQEIGEWIVCSIGISTNMMLAKLAASLHKPDGLDVIDHSNLLWTYDRIKLMDFNGINSKFQARLNINGIYTPLDFYRAKTDLLEKKVFQSVLGRRWFEKLRGYEADQRDFPTKSIGQQYALKIPTNDPRELSRLMMKLCEKMGRRLRRKGLNARGIHLWCLYKDYTTWHRGRLMDTDMYTTQELYRCVQLLLNQQPARKSISKIGVSCYDLFECYSSQMTLFDMTNTRARKAADAADSVNDKFGEFTVIPGIMLDMDDLILDRIAFGGVKELEDLYQTVSV